MHIALESGNIHVSRELLCNNGDVQVKATYGVRTETAFHAAARKRDVELLRLLSDNGSQVDAVNVIIVQKLLFQVFSNFAIDCELIRLIEIRF